MNEKRIMNEEDLMVDFAEMTSFDFNSLDYEQMQELHRITDSEYAKKPYAFKFGKFDLTDMFKSLIAQKEI